MLGHKLFQLLSTQRDDVWCTLREPKVASRLTAIPLFSRDNIIWAVDASDWPSMKATISSHRPDFVINTIGLIKQRPSGQEPVATLTANALLPHLIADTLASWNGRLIHVSTDCVFSGTKGKYVESDRSDAEDQYGKSKHLGELQSTRNALTLRTSIIGRELTHSTSLLEWFLRQRNRQINGFAKVVYSGVTTIEMARVVSTIIDRHPNLHGLYHVASAPITKFDLLTLVNDRLHIEADIVKVDQPVNDRSLVSDRFVAETCYVVPPWAAMIEALAVDPTPYDEWRQLLM